MHNSPLRPMSLKTLNKYSSFKFDDKKIPLALQFDKCIYEDKFFRKLLKNSGGNIFNYSTKLSELLDKVKDEELYTKSMCELFLELRDGCLSNMSKYVGSYDVNMLEYDHISFLMMEYNTKMSMVKKNINIIMKLKYGFIKFAEKVQHEYAKHLEVLSNFTYICKDHMYRPDGAIASKAKSKFK